MVTLVLPRLIAFEGPVRRSASVAERNVAASFEFAQKLLHAKDAQEVTTLQAEYLKSQLATLTEQAKELSQSAAKMSGHS